MRRTLQWIRWRPIARSTTSRVGSGRCSPRRSVSERWKQISHYWTSYRSAGARARCTTQKASRRQIKIEGYPGKLEVWEDEDPTKAVEYFLLQAEKEILKNRTKWDAQHERWEKNRTKNVELVVETEHVARRRVERDKALKQISELDWLLDNHTLSEPMRVPNGWFRKALS